MQQKATSATAAGKPRGILLADDEEILRRTLKSYLQNRGLRVFDAPDGQAALELYRAEAANIDLVLLDWTMPRLGGAETLAALRKLSPSLPVIVTSGHTGESMLEGFEGLEVQAFLEKPFGLKELLELIDEILPTRP